MLDEESMHCRNEYQKKVGKVITDSCFQVVREKFHIECQSAPDSVMALKMIDYDFKIAKVACGSAGKWDDKKLSNEEIARRCECTEDMVQDIRKAFDI